MLYIENNTLGPISHISVGVLTAQSYDEQLKDWRDGRPFKPFRNEYSSTLDSGHITSVMWLLRKTNTIGGGVLMIGSVAKGEAQLKWPNNDKSKVHQWLLSLSIFTQTEPPDDHHKPVDLEPINIKVIGIWDPHKNEFSMDIPF
jgi:hypothetical protein